MMEIRYSDGVKMAHVSHRYFLDEVLRQAGEQLAGSRDKLVYMTPGQFLSVAMSGFNPAKEKSVADALASGCQFDEIPFLNFVHDGEGTARVIGHEGRHRAMAFAKEGIEEFPVLLRHRYDENGQAMVWDRIENDPLFFKDPWPERLYGERGFCGETKLHASNFIPFPVPDPSSLTLECEITSVPRSRRAFSP